jgi:hypothetical protein
MTYIIDVDKINQTENAYLSPLNGKTECVAMVQAAPPVAGSSNPPNTSTWRPGIWVHGAQQGTIKKGTVIATFLNNIYPSGGAEKPRHAAVYLSHNDKGITVIDQWKGAIGSTPGNHRPLTFRGLDNRSVDNGDLFYVVELTTLPGQAGPSSTEGSTGINEQTLQ